MDVPLDDTFAEAFPMTAARLVVTAATAGWARTAGLTATGYAASVIGCDAEAGIERELSPADTPDGRPGVSLLLFAFSRDALQKAAVNRVGQCVLTCPTSAFCRASRLKPKNSRLTPGRPSGVSSGASSRSMPASASQPITLAA